MVVHGIDYSNGVNVTADDIRAEVKKALKEFGRYQFGDKGAREVMFLEPILTHLKSLTAEDARALLEDVAKSKEPMCARLVQDLVSDLDRQPDEWFNTLMESDLLVKMY
jgi:hypothetical protein